MPLPRHVLSAREAELVLAQPDTGTPIGLRNRAIRETFYSTGIRRMELVGLHLTDVDSDRGTLLVRQGKDRKDRMIPIGARALQSGATDRHEAPGRHGRERRRRARSAARPARCGSG